MSPRRRFQWGEEPLLTEWMPRSTLWSRLPRWRSKLSSRWWKPSRKWVQSVAAAVLAAAAIATSAVVLIDHRSRQQVTVKDVDVLGFVRAFMTRFTSVDPFHANDYVDWILAYATGDFAEQYRDKHNEILIRIAQGEPTKGTALGAGVERWNDDGSANVLVATGVTFNSPDGKQSTEHTSRWVVTAQREGKQWKISNLLQVI